MWTSLEKPEWEDYCIFVIIVTPEQTDGKKKTKRQRYLLALSEFLEQCSLLTSRTGTSYSTQVDVGPLALSRTKRSDRLLIITCKSIPLRALCSLSLLAQPSVHPAINLFLWFVISLDRFLIYNTTHFGLYYIERYSLLSDTVLLLCFRQPELHRQRRSIDVDFHGNTTQKRWRAAAVVAVLATSVVHADDNLCQIPYCNACSKWRCLFLLSDDMYFHMYPKIWAMPLTHRTIAMMVVFLVPRTGGRCSHRRRMPW